MEQDSDSDIEDEGDNVINQRRQDVEPQSKSELPPPPPPIPKDAGPKLPPLPPNPEQVIIRKDYNPKGNMM
jgi:hypothetical protein